MVKPEFTPTRLVFANQLRGLAVLCVVFGHYVGVYWGGRELVSSFTATPVEAGALTPIYFLASQQWFNFGPFGVAIFFLISGLVVPISLGHHNGVSFLMARFIRIMPTFMIGASLCLGVVWMNSRFWSIPFPPGFDADVIGGTLFLIQNYLTAAHFTLVAWTLCIEWKFYIIVAMMAPAIRRDSVPALFSVALLCLAINLSWTIPAVENFSESVPQFWQVGFETTFVIFMLIGVLFNYHVRGLIGTTTLGLSILAFVAIFIASFSIGPMSIEFPRTPVNYGYALVLFSLAYSMRNHFRSIKIIDFLADISFPMYVIHSIVGYSAFKLLMMEGNLPYLWAFPVTLCIVMGIAFTLHVTIERSSIRAGRRLGRPSRRTAGQGVSA